MLENLIPFARKRQPVKAANVFLDPERFFRPRTSTDGRDGMRKKNKVFFDFIPKLDLFDLHTQRW